MEEQNNNPIGLESREFVRLIRLDSTEAVSDLAPLLACYCNSKGLDPLEESARYAEMLVLPLGVLWDEVESCLEFLKESPVNYTPLQPGDLLKTVYGSRWQEEEDNAETTE